MKKGKIRKDEVQGQGNSDRQTYTYTCTCIPNYAHVQCIWHAQVLDYITCMKGSLVILVSHGSICLAGISVGLSDCKNECSCSIFADAQCQIDYCLHPVVNGAVIIEHFE